MAHRYWLKALIATALIYSACFYVIEASFLENVLNNLNDQVHGKFKGKLHATLEDLGGQVQETVGKISVLAAYFGNGITRRDLTLPQIFTEVFSRKNAIPVNNSNGKAWMSADGSIIAAVVTNGATLSISKKNGTVIVVSDTSSGSDIGASATTSNTETGAEGVSDIDSTESKWKGNSNVDEVEDLTSPLPALPLEDEIPIDQTNADDAMVELMSDWNAFISSNIWEEQDVRSRKQASHKGQKSSMEESTRIVNGISIENRMASGAPFSVKFFYDNEKMFYCSGSLIGYPYALTAAHCAVQVGDDVRLGGTELRSGLKATVSAVVKHPAFDARTFAHDIAVIRLIGLPERKALFRYGVHAARLNKVAEFPKQGFIGVVSAHGAVDTNGHTVSNMLRSTRQRTYNYNKCATEITHGNIQQHKSFLCVGDKERSTTCLGDSGAGLWRFRTTLVGNKSVEAFYQVYGIVSFGEVTDQTLCPLGPPSVFQRTSTNFKWIEEVVGEPNLG